MKVDSNTKGNMYWFNYRVQNFRVGVRYTFNIYNFTRSMDKFYKDGMNIAVKIDGQGGDDTSESQSLDSEDTESIQEDQSGEGQELLEDTHSKGETRKVGERVENFNI